MFQPPAFVCGTPSVGSGGTITCTAASCPRGSTADLAAMEDIYCFAGNPGPIL
jgi:hypothetical protein